MDNNSAQTQGMLPVNAPQPEVDTTPPMVNANTRIPPQKGEVKRPSIFLIILAIILFLSLIFVASYLYFEIKSPTSRGLMERLTPTPTPTPRNEAEVKVLSISYFPIKDGVLDRSVIASGLDTYNMSIDQARERITNLDNELATALQEGSKYRFYQNQKSTPALMYHVSDRVELFEEIPISNKTYQGNTDLKVTDYASILNKQDICKMVDEFDIKEVWLWGYPSTNRRAWKSNLITTDGINISINNMDSSDFPRCTRSYTVYENDYGLDSTEAIKNHLTQFQNIFLYLNQNLFWNKFVGFFVDENWTGNLDPLPDSSRRCGSFDWPPNSNKQFDWANKNYVETDCIDWRPDGYGSRISINCDAWNCNERDYFVFWMQNIPGPYNNLSDDGRDLRNWWEFIVDFDGAMKVGKNLVY